MQTDFRELGAHVFVAYVDGSIDPKSGQAAWGLAIYQDKKLVHEAWDKVDYRVLPEDARQSRQVAGELVAAMEAVLWARQRQTKVALVFDFTGIHHWVTGKWRAKKKLTQYYRDFMRDNIYYIDDWCWVRGHSGIPGNEKADQLAKRAVGK